MRALSTTAVVSMLLAFTASASAQTPATAGAADPYMARALRVLRQSPVVDGHNDLPWRIREDTAHRMDVEGYDLRTRTPGMTDLARLAAGHVGGQFWSIYIPGEPTDPAYQPKGAVASRPGYARVQLEQIDIARRVIARYPELEWTPSADALRASFGHHRVGSLLGLEGGHAIENSLNLLRVYYELGARYMTLTHNVTLDWADAALDSAKHHGLTPFGREVVREMNRLGMLVDLAHVSPGTMSAALDVTEAPVIFSHSGSRALVDHRRNVPDSILARLPKNGGVVMVPFVTSFVSAAVKADDDSLEKHGASWRASHPRPVATIADVADHIDHIRRIAGVDHVGIGSDFDGITDNVVGLEDVSKFPALFAELARRGWTDADLAKLASGNVIRVLKQAEQVSARLKKTRKPSTATIEQLDRGAAVQTSCSSCAIWNAPQKPFRIFGNTYWVGSHGLGSILVTSPSGHVLIDGGLPETAPLIAAHVAELGFRMEDVKLILNSHVHYDHAGGLAALQRASRAPVAALPASAPALTRGASGTDDPQYGVLPTFPAVANVRVIADGDTVRAGTLALVAHRTAGHTPGGTTWSWTSCEGARCLGLVYADSQTPISADDFYFTRSSTYSTGVTDFEHGATVLDHLRCDILITPHPDASGLWERLAARDGGKADALVDTTACRTLATTARAALARRLAAERAALR